MNEQVQHKIHIEVIRLFGRESKSLQSLIDPYDYHNRNALE